MRKAGLLFIFLTILAGFTAGFQGDTFGNAEVNNSTLILDDGRFVSSTLNVKNSVEINASNKLTVKIQGSQNEFNNIDKEQEFTAKKGVHTYPVNVRKGQKRYVLKGKNVSVYNVTFLDQKVSGPTLGFIDYERYELDLEIWKDGSGINKVMYLPVLSSLSTVLKAFLAVAAGLSAGVLIRKWRKGRHHSKISKVNALN